MRANSCFSKLILQKSASTQDKGAAVDTVDAAPLSISCAWSVYDRAEEAEMTFGDNTARSAAYGILCFFLSLATNAQAQTPEHIEAARLNLEKSPIRSGACTPVTETFLSWPENTLQRCEYKQGNAQGLAYVLDVKAETLAKWIETSCSAQMSGVAACFDRILRCTTAKSNSSFVVGGNAITEKSGTTQNNFFRNGVAINAAPNGKAETVSLEDQENLAKIPEADIAALPGGGGVAFWHTLPYQFAVKAIDLGVPAELNTPDRRQKWLEIIRLEMLAALGKSENRFLSGWMNAHPIMLRAGECPDDRDP